jgi:hypothetical protein
MGKVALAIILIAAMCGAARAQTPSTAQLLQDWTCAAGKCTTTCAGPGGPLTISAHDVKVFQFSLHIRRLWLDADGQIFVLGDDDRCQFGGATSSPIDFVNPPVEVSPTPPVPPACTCIGNQCTPPGCAPPRVSPLR